MRKLGVVLFALYLCGCSSNVKQNLVQVSPPANQGQNDNMSGVWVKFGTAITPIAADANTVLFGGTSNQDVLYDTNPQLISANSDGKVFKMWFMGKNDLFYAESNDGKAWTRRGTALLTTTGEPRVWKDGSTYYIYATTGEPTQGNQGITTYTSTDGITLVSQGIGLAVGGVGQFDNGGVFYLKPFQKVGNTWSATYSSLGGDGIATSTDLISWTNAASKLNLGAHTGGGCYPLVVNGTYYIYTATQINSGNNALARVSSTDLVNWTAPIQIIAETLLQEGAGDSISEGQGVPTVVQGPSNTTFLYYSGAKTGVNNGSSYTILGASAAMSLSSLVQTPEGLVPDTYTQLATDNFTRANENPLSQGGNWTKPGADTALNIVSNLCQSTSNTIAGDAIYTGLSWSADQYSEVTVNAIQAGGEIRVKVRDNAAALASNSSYFIQILGVGASKSVKLFKVVAGAFTQLGSTQTVTVTAGDVFRCAVRGNIISAFQNGAQIGTLTPVTDTDIASGTPGLLCTANGTASLTNASAWAGGSVTVPATSSATGDNGPSGNEGAYIIRYTNRMKKRMGYADGL